MAAHFGKVEAFDADTDTWPLYQERLQQFFEANKIEDTGKQRAILPSVCRRKTYQLLRNLMTPDKPADKTFDDLCALLRNHFAQALSEIVQRYRFHSRNRQPGESISFMAELRKLSEHCNWANIGHEDPRPFGVRSAG